MSGLDLEALRTRHSDLGLEIAESGGDELRVSISSVHARTLLVRLRDEDETAMKRLVDLTAIDRGGERARFELVYRLQSIERDCGLRLHARVEGAQTELADAARADSVPLVDSVTSLWPAANWLEREVFDLFGIRFKGHPDLRRILLDEAFEGAPLRRDHPLRLERPLPSEGDR